jgi:hypothetical protein
MSLEAEDDMTQLLNDNQEIIKLLKAQVYLLELLAGRDINTTLNIVED